MRDQKASEDQQHKMELTALSSNLATVRHQLEDGKRRVQEAEATTREKTSKMEGEYIVCYGYITSSISQLNKSLQHCQLLNVFACAELNEQHKSLQDEHRALLEKWV